MTVPIRYHLDANVLIRFLIGEPKMMFDGAAALIERASRGEVVLDLHPLVLAETAFTLQSFYKVPRRKVAATLREFVLRSGVCLAEEHRMIDALNRVEKTGVHLVDAYLASVGSETGQPVASFDRDLDSFNDVIRYQPVKSEEP